MFAAAEVYQYEKAAQLRDRVRQLRDRLRGA
jgi:protein-arginine kinase activator protein McsA